jgi:RIO kinase 1
MEKLQQLLDEGVLDEVYNQLKTGKEAEVWLVSHHGEPVAAKIYKAREFRSFKNDAGYREGRQVRNTRTQRAIDKGSKFGRESAEDAWKSMEADTMFTLHAAGVRVPKPVMFYEGVLLMEVVGDAEGRVAPRLVEAHIPREQAEALYVLLRQEVIKMLAEDYIHGDLSEFNILLGANGPVIIDFPQVVTAAKNSQSEKYFRRDLGNLLRFFSAIDPSIEQRHGFDADEIWREYVRRDLSPGFTPSGRRPFQGGPPRQGGGPQRGGPSSQGRRPEQRQGAFQRAGQPGEQRGEPSRGRQPGAHPRGGPQGEPQRGGPQRGAQQGDQQRGGPPRGRPQGEPRRGEQPRRDPRGAPSQGREGSPPQRDAGAGGGRGPQQGRGGRPPGPVVERRPAVVSGAPQPTEPGSNDPRRRS